MVTMFELVGLLITVNCQTSHSPAPRLTLPNETPAVSIVIGEPAFPENSTNSPRYPAGAAALVSTPRMLPWMPPLPGSSGPTVLVMTDIPPDDQMRTRSRMFGPWVLLVVQKPRRVLIKLSPRTGVPSTAQLIAAFTAGV